MRTIQLLPKSASVCTKQPYSTTGKVIYNVYSSFKGYPTPILEEFRLTSIKLDLYVKFRRHSLPCRGLAFIIDIYLSIWNLDSVAPRRIEPIAIRNQNYNWNKYYCPFLMGYTTCSNISSPPVRITWSILWNMWKRDHCLNIRFINRRVCGNEKASFKIHYTNRNPSTALGGLGGLDTAPSFALSCSFVSWWITPSPCLHLNQG